MAPIGLAGSGGSTPLRLRLRRPGRACSASSTRRRTCEPTGGTSSSARSCTGDWRTRPRSSRCAGSSQYEDYTLRVIRDAGIPTAAPFGIVELTPEREYLVVTEFFDGAAEISEADVDDDVIDQGLAVVRRLWDAGLAHRDIKPANVLVRTGSCS